MKHSENKKGRLQLGLRPEPRCGSLRRSPERSRLWTGTSFSFLFFSTPLAPGSRHLLSINLFEFFLLMALLTNALSICIYNNLLSCVNIVTRDIDTGFDVCSDDNKSQISDHLTAFHSLRH